MYYLEKLTFGEYKVIFFLNGLKLKKNDKVNLIYILSSMKIFLKI